jgi:hypothetical protein
MGYKSIIKITLHGMFYSMLKIMKLMPVEKTPRKNTNLYIKCKEMNKYGEYFGNGANRTFIL